MSVCILHAQSLTLDQACELALKNNIDLQQEAINLELDRISAKSLWAQVFPSISAGGGMSYTIPVKDDVQRSDPSYTATFRVSLGLNAGLPYTMKAISLAYKSGLLNFEQARRHLVLETAKSFYDLLAQKDNLQVLEGAMRLAAEQLERDRIARQNGYVGELTYLSSSLSAEQAKLDYNRALSEYHNGLGNFLAALGMEQSDISLKGAIEIAEMSLDPEVLIQTYLPRRPDLMFQYNEIERLKNARNAAVLAAKAPTVDLSASWGAVYPDGFNDVVSAGISVTIPVNPWIPRTIQNQALRVPGAAYERALLELQNVERNARQEIRNYTESIRNTWAEVEIARQRVRYAERAYELAEQAYRTGSMNFLDYETMRNNLTQSRQKLLQSELAYKILVLDLASSLDMDESELRTVGEEK
jgi:outer membrane protein TolC